MTYADWQPSKSATALQFPYGNSHQRAYGIIKDNYIDTARAAVKMRFPDFASPDALGAIGSERLMEQGIDTLTGANESSAAYAARLKNAWGANFIRGDPPDVEDSVWYWGGTGFGMLRAFALLGYGQNATIIQQSGTYWSLDVSNNLVITDNPPLTGWPFWNSFLVLFSLPASWTSPAVPATSGTVPDSDEIDRLVRLINLWKPAHMFCLGLQVNVSGRFWGYPPVGAGGAPVWGTGTWGGVGYRWPVPNTPPCTL